MAIRTILSICLLLSTLSACDSSCTAPFRSGEAVDWSVIDYMPADAPYTVVLNSSPGDSTVWAGKLPEDPYPSQYILQLAIDLFLSGSEGVEQLDLSEYQPGTLGVYGAEASLIAMLEVGDAEGALSSIYEWLEPQVNTNTHQLRLIEDEGNRALLLRPEEGGSGQNTEHAIVISEHPGVLVFVVSNTLSEKQLISKARDITRPERPINESALVQRARVQQLADSRERFIVNIDTQAVAAKLWNENQKGEREERCVTAEQQLIARLPQMVVVQSENRSSASMSIRMAVDSTAREKFAKVFEPGLEAYHSVADFFPIVLSVGLSSVQDVINDVHALHGYAPCSGLIGKIARFSQFGEGFIAKLRGAKGQANIMVGVQQRALTAMNEGMGVLALFELGKPSRAIEWHARLFPPDQYSKVNGTITIDDVEHTVSGHPSLGDIWYSMMEGGRLWVSDYQFTRDELVGLMIAPPGGPPLSFGLSPARMRRSLSVVQRQMGLAMESVVQAEPDEHIDSQRLAASLAFTNGLIDTFKAVERIYGTVKLDGQDLVIQIR